MMRFTNFFQQLFCRHSWHSKGWYEAYDTTRNVRHSIHVYTCRKCSKWKEVDGRFDKIRG